MSNENKVEPMPDSHFRGMVWLFKLVDIFKSPLNKIKNIPLKEGLTVVDYGCGPGRYTMPVARLVGDKGKVFAVDIQPMAISIVKKKTASKALTNVETILVDSYKTGIEGASIDLVLLIDTFHSVSDKGALLKEIHRIIKQDGILFMDPGHMKLEEAVEIVEGSGILTIQERHGNDMLVTRRG